MEEEDWKKMIQNWESSRKHLKIKQKLKKLKMYNMNKEELEEMIDGIMEFASLSDEEKEAFDWLDTEFQTQANKDEIIYSLIQTLLKWYYYQIKFEKEGEFMLCAQIRDVVEVEIKECIRLIKTYFIIEEEDLETIDRIKIESRKRIINNFNDWDEIINE